MQTVEKRIFLLGQALLADGVTASDVSKLLGGSGSSTTTRSNDSRTPLGRAMLQLQRQKMWVTSQDEEFREKRDDVLHVYYDTPPIPMEPAQPIRREFEYIRHGTLCLMGAYDVRGGKLFGFTDEKRGQRHLRRPA